ncbi:MAG TPA: hypothetical protein DCL15_13880 [Chloroflexi bacterium]|nr:hypothetical protein [Chloroflexota bacterium]HHW86376.1 hypothetical protein [Chloroflexota bacterium]
MFTGKYSWAIGGLLAAAMLLAACGGAAQQGTPTPIPASVVRPVQPTPVYPARADVFTLATPMRTPIFVSPTPEPPPAVALSAVESGPVGWQALLAIEQPPSAMGIATGGAVIYDAPGGRVRKNVPATSVLTVTGVSADGRWLSVYDEDAVFGWTPATQLVLYGADDLITVTVAVDPAIVATLIADVMQPVNVLDNLMATLAPTPTPR